MSSFTSNTLKRTELNTGYEIIWGTTLFDRFDFSGADNYPDNDNFTMVIFNDNELPKVSLY